MWIGLVVVGLALLWFRKPRHVTKAPVPTEYSEVEIREMFTALTLARSTAPFRQIQVQPETTTDRYEEFG